MKVEPVVVLSIDGLYDEKSEALTMNIAVMKSHLFAPHDWVNASLHFERANFHVSIENSRPPEGFGPAWGGGYGGIRYCRLCKLIDCVHLWDERTTYEVRHGDFYCVRHTVSSCRVCKRRIHGGSTGVCQPSAEASRIIDEVIASLGKDQRVMGSYGSGWFCELPVAVSRVLADQGEEAAKRYVLGMFGPEGCSDAVQKVLGA